MLNRAEASKIVISRKLLEEAAATGRFRLKFPRYLEERFEAETGPVRSRQLRNAVLVCLLLYDAFILDDFNLLPDIAARTTAVRLGIMTPIGLALAHYLRRDREN